MQKGIHWKAIQLVTVSVLTTFYPLMSKSETLPHPENTGPHNLRTIEFQDLVDTQRGSRRVPIKIHLPKFEGRWPVIIFSHGAGGSWNANYAQAQHLASHGYAVLCVEHVGSNTSKMKKSIRFLKNVKDMTRDAEEVLNRPRDISFAIDRAIEWDKQHAELAGTLDTARIGVTGHSFGAFTTLAILGARPALDWLQPTVGSGKGLGPDFSDSRVLAGVALSPQGPGEPFFLDSSYAGLERPLLGITGSRDKQQGAEPEHRRRFFELIPAGDKLFLWLNNADHLAFSDSTGSGQRGFRSRSRKEVQPIARAATLLFFEGHLRGDEASLARIKLENFQHLLGKVVDGVEILQK